MRPSEVHARVLDDHAALRERIDVIDALSDSFEKGGREVGTELREQAAALYEVFAAHLSLEDAHLVPALEKLPEIGPPLASRLLREHREQRELILYLLSRLEQEEHPTSLIASEIQNFANYLRTDMMHEESAIVREELLQD